MNLDEAQKSKVSEWIQQGLEVAEIQQKLASDLDVHMTYMEVRFLLTDLNLNPKDRESTPIPNLDAQPEEPAPTPPAGPGIPAEPDAGGALGGGKVSVSVDHVARPGALASGKVTFSDGKNADWTLDQFGRLGLAGTSPGYRPPEADLATFQQELQNQLGRLGY